MTNVTGCREHVYLPVTRNKPFGWIRRDHAQNLATATIDSRSTHDARVPLSRMLVPRRLRTLKLGFA
jgi:hypothetical protein